LPAVCDYYKQQCLPTHPGSEHADEGIVRVTSYKCLTAKDGMKF